MQGREDKQKQNKTETETEKEKTLLDREKDAKISTSKWSLPMFSRGSGLMSRSTRGDLKESGSPK